jgi:hypothetical protein
VRRAWLWGYDAYAGQDYSHRKAWVPDRLRCPADIFSVDLCAYAISSKAARVGNGGHHDCLPSATQAISIATAFRQCSRITCNCSIGVDAAGVLARAALSSRIYRRFSLDCELIRMRGCK